MRKIYLFIFLLFASLTMKAQFTVDAFFRLRSEFKDGYKTLLDDTKQPAFVTSQRSRLNIDYTDDKFKFYVSLYDARVWGEEVLGADASTVGVHEAYVAYSLSTNLTINLGRQELNYDNKRLIADKNWNNAGAAHDLAILKYAKESWQIHGAFAYNNNVDKTSESDYNLNLYKYLAFIWLHKDLSEGMKISVMNIFDGNQKTGDYETIYTRGTSGFLYELDASHILGEVSAYFQYGKLNNGQKVSAYMFSIAPMYKVNDKIKVGLGIDYFSGTDAFGKGTKSNAFSNLFGSGHKYCGSMDYFTTINTSTKNGGLNDMYLKAIVNPSEKINAELTLHNFQFTNQVVDSITSLGELLKADKQLGTEVDFVLKYKFYKRADLSIGYSAMLASPSMELLKGGDADKMQNWLWLSLQFRPVLFKQSK